MERTTALFSHLNLRSVELKNRIVVSPMCMYSSEDGFSNDWHLVHLGTRAVGGAGLVITEATAVSPEGRISPDDLGLWKDEQIEGLKRITKFLKEQGSVPGIQLAHAGRKASTTSPWKGYDELREEEGGWKPVAPSAVAFKEGGCVPEALNGAGIQKVISDFKMSAERALKAGFQVVEIHAAHGYLLHEFLSPLSNLRNDEYGETLENRCRLLLEVVKAVREVWPTEFPLFVRISATDWAEGGWNETEAVYLAGLLKKYEVDLVDCSSGGLVPYAEIPVGKGYQVGFAEKIKREAGIKTGAVGLITESQQAEEILQQGKADLIFMARELLRNPYFPMEAAEALGADFSWPPQYERAKKIR